MTGRYVSFLDTSRPVIPFPNFPDCFHTHHPCVLQKWLFEVYDYNYRYLVLPLHKFDSFTKWAGPEINLDMQHDLLTFVIFEIDTE